MQAPEFLELISETNQLDHFQRSTLSKALGQLDDKPKVYDLIECIFDDKGVCPHCSHAGNYRHGINYIRSIYLPFVTIQKVK